MNNTVKNKITQNNSQSGSIRLSGKIFNPKRDWSILIILFTMFVVASLGFDFYMYQQIVSGDMYVSIKRDELVIENLKSDDLQKILNNFETKKSNMMNFKLGNLVDPSI